MRLLGVDLGRRRIGIAIGESILGIATPRPMLAASGKLDTDADVLAALARREAVDRVVVGIPLMADAADGGAMQRACRELAERLRRRELDVDLCDEAYTSIEAADALRQTGLTAAQRKGRIDSEAAARILERYMSESGRIDG